MFVECFGVFVLMLWGCFGCYRLFVAFDGFCFAICFVVFWILFVVWLGFLRFCLLMRACCCIRVCLFWGFGCFDFLGVSIIWILGFRLLPDWFTLFCNCVFSCLLMLVGLIVVFDLFSSGLFCVCCVGLILLFCWVLVVFVCFGLVGWFSLMMI